MLIVVKDDLKAVGIESALREWTYHQLCLYTACCTLGSFSASRAYVLMACKHSTHLTNTTEIHSSLASFWIISSTDSLVWHTTPLLGCVCLLSAEELNFLLRHVSLNDKELKDYACLMHGTLWECAPWHLEMFALAFAWNDDSFNRWLKKLWNWLLRTWTPADR